MAIHTNSMEHAYAAAQDIADEQPEGAWVIARPSGWFDVIPCRGNPRPSDDEGLVARITAIPETRH